MTKQSFLLFLTTFVLFDLPLGRGESTVEKVDEELTSRITNYKINARYKAGEYLIYDCENGHYACVDRDGNDLCQSKRQEAIDKKKEIYPCAPLKKLQNKTQCLHKNYEVVESIAAKRFCYPK